MGVFGCAASRGPTVCHHGTCYCEEGSCVVNEDPVALSALHGNLTAEDMAEAQRKEDMAVSLNVLLFCLYMAMVATAVAGGLVLLRRRRAPAVEVSDYKLLAA